MKQRLPSDGKWISPLPNKVALPDSSFASDICRMSFILFEIAVIPLVCGGGLLPLDTLYSRDQMTA